MREIVERRLVDSSERIKEARAGRGFCDAGIGRDTPHPIPYIENGTDPPSAEEIILKVRQL